MVHPLTRAAAALAAIALSVPIGSTASATPHAPAPAASEASATARRVNVVVLLRQQPTAPSATTEDANISTQDALLEDWRSRYGLTVERQFGYLLNGFSATMPASSMLALAQESAVASVRLERTYKRLTTSATGSTGSENGTETTASTALNPTDERTSIAPAEHAALTMQGVPAAYERYGTDGTGTVISIIDSGIDPSHQDMRLDDCSAAKITTINPAPEAHFTCKVPNGYNYADENYVIKDSTADQHGMHVAGIAAANGSTGTDSALAWANQRIDGVAPNAQLLAMKVFSNNGDNAYDSDIIAAIEDSVKLGADVINMSLGSDNGVNNASDGLWRALAKAREQGVLVDVAAGNSGLNFAPDGAISDDVGYLDDGTLGSPGAHTHAFTVASIDNNLITSPIARYSGPRDAHGETMYQIATGAADNQPHPLVDLGTATTKETTGLRLEGAWALVERGSIPFKEKYTNAVAAGAGGIILFNSAAGGEELFTPAEVDTFSVPGAVIPRSAGLALRDSIRAGATTMTLTTTVSTTANPTGGAPSSFTSWGPSPDLQFKPEIAAVGGSVYSTVNDNKYATKSGTSMATPNISGMAALLIEEYTTRYPGLSAAERADLVRTALMNTAAIPAHDSVPYAPRQIGAGLAQVDKALATPVTATVDGAASLALGTVSGPRSFTVTLTNRGDAPAQYAVADQQVIGETNTAGQPTTTHVSGTESLTASASQVTVPARGSATVTFTLSADTSFSHYVEGWARLTATDGNPDLAVPYLGFVGDWNAEPIVREPGSTLPYDAGQSATGLVTSWAGMTIPVSSELGTFAISPNGDGDMDVVAPDMLLMRNASDVTYEVLDADGTLVREIGQEQALSRTTAAIMTASQASSAYVASSYVFDGTVWDAAQGRFVPVPEGTYSYRVRARLTPQSAWQDTVMPFTLDRTPPQVSVTGPDAGGTVTITVTDATLMEDSLTVSTDSGEMVSVTKVSSAPAGTSGDLGLTTTVFSATPPAGTHHLTVTAMDRGQSLSVASAIVDPDSFLVVPDAESLATTVLGPQSQLVTMQGSTPVLQLQGVAATSVTAVTVNGEPVEVSQGRFTALVPLREGAQDITLTYATADGAAHEPVLVHVLYDSTAPTLTITGTDADGALTPREDGSVTVTGTVRDERADAQLTVTVAGATVPVTDGAFTTTITPAATATSVVVTASDGANRTTRDVPIAGRTASQATQGPAVTLTNAGCDTQASACFVARGSRDLSGQTFTVRGTVSAQVARISVTEGSRLDGDADGVDAPAVPVTVEEDGTFSAPVPVSTGMNDLRVRAWSADGSLVWDRALRVAVDLGLPHVAFDSPVLYDGVLYTSSDTVSFTGRVEDDGRGYALSLNGDVVVEVYNQTGLGAEVNGREFSRDLAVSDGDTVLALVQDAFGNSLVGTIPVVADSVAPQAQASWEAARVTSGGTSVSMTGTDAHLASLQVSVDGQPRPQLLTDTAMHAGSVESVMSEGTDDAALSARSAAAAGGQTSLVDTIDTSTLPVGVHTVTATVTDLAGNATTLTRELVVDRAATITGDSPVSITLPLEQVQDQQALVAAVLAHFSVEDDGAVSDDGLTVYPASATTVSLAPGTVLGTGTQSVTLVATDGAGHRVERSVEVSITATSEPPADTGSQSGTTAPQPGTQAGSGHADHGGVPGAGQGAGSSPQPGRGAPSAGLARTGSDVLVPLWAATAFLTAGIVLAARAARRRVRA